MRRREEEEIKKTSARVWDMIQEDFHTLMGDLHKIRGCENLDKDLVRLIYNRGARRALQRIEEALKEVYP